MFSRDFFSISYLTAPVRTLYNVSEFFLRDAHEALLEVKEKTIKRPKKKSKDYNHRIQMKAKVFLFENPADDN